MTATRELSRDEFLACFQRPMSEVRETSGSATAASNYAALLPRDGITPTGVVSNIYRDAGARFDQVLMATETANVFLVIVIDLGTGSVYGHRVLDLNAEYGLD